VKLNIFKSKYKFVYTNRGEVARRVVSKSRRFFYAVFATIVALFLISPLVRSADPIVINTCLELQSISAIENLDKEYVLGQSINCSETKNWNPIEFTDPQEYYGFEPIGTSDNPFTGKFDGAGYTISGLYINRIDTEGVGLFGYASSAQITDLNLNIDSIVGDIGVGALIGYADTDTTVSKVHITGGPLTSFAMWPSYGSYTGGLVGEIDGEIENSSSAVDVFAHGVNTGGLVGELKGHITGSSATGNVTVEEIGDSFYISQLNNNQFEEKYKHHYSTTYKPATFEFNPSEGNLTLRITQKHAKYAAIDQLTLKACNTDVEPLYAKYLSYDTDVKSDILSLDNNVIIAHDRVVEISWVIPTGCQQKVQMTMVANEYGGGSPLSFVGEYELGQPKNYSPYWMPTSGHPKGFTYIKVHDDKDNIYFNVDITPDNTDDKDYDWAAITINSKAYKITHNNQEYGQCIFGYSDKVKYKHAMCNFILPKQEIGAIRSVMDFQFQYYGTASAGGVGGLVGYLSEGDIDNSFTNGGNVSSNTRATGGLVGNNWGTISNSHSTSALVSSAEMMLGGLVGLNRGNIAFSHSSYSVEGDSWIGGLVGSNGPDGVINSSYSERGEVVGDSWIGGLVGENFGQINSSYADNTARTIEGGYAVGGLVGVNYGPISGSYSNNPSSNITGEHNVGGLVGLNEAEGAISSSQSISGQIKSTNDTLGGLVGLNLGTITSSRATSSLIGEQGEVGGLVGSNLYSGLISKSCSGIGTVAADSGPAGGLVGFNMGDIENSYATGNVSGDGYVGGLVGDSANDPVIKNSYSSGDVIIKPMSYFAGGLIGISDTSLIRSAFTVSKMIGANESGEEYHGSFAGVGTSSLIINSGHLKQGSLPAIALDNDAEGEELWTNSITYNETNKAAYYNKSHGVYTADNDSLWDFTNIWRQQDNNLPILVGVEKCYISTSPPTPPAPPPVTPPAPKPPTPPKPADPKKKKHLIKVKVHNRPNNEVCGGGCGKVIPDGDIYVDDATNQRFVFNTGTTRLMEVLLDGTPIGVNEEYEIKNIKSDHTLEATFIQQYKIEVEETKNATVIPSKYPQKADYGSDFQFSVTAKKGYKITNITANGTSITSSCSYQNGISNCDLKNIKQNYLIKISTKRLEGTVAGATENRQNFFVRVLGSLLSSISTARKSYINLIKDTPPPVAYSFPWLLFILLAILAYRLMRQTQGEVKHANTLARSLAFEEGIAIQKDGFLALSSHYLRTPITIIKGGVELYMSTGQAVDQVKSQIQKAVDGLDTSISRIFKMIDSNSYLATIIKPDVKQEQKKLFKTPYLWMPPLFIIGVAIYANFMFIRVAGIDIKIVNLLTQIVAFALATQVFIHYFRKKQASKTENLKKEEDLVKMQTLDNTRNEFMENSALTIDRGVRQYDDSAKQVEDKDKLKMAQKGVDNLKDIGNKFTTIAALQKGEIEANKEPLNISQIISQILQKHQQKISDKVLKINSELEDITFNTDKEKLTFILDTVIDNAIKFSKKNGLVKIQLKISTDKAQIIVEDNGIGMSEQAQKILFKPFSRGTSTLTFDYEGMGTNLYVAKLMCSYLDANIEFESQKDKGAKVKITINN